MRPIPKSLLIHTATVVDLHPGNNWTDEKSQSKQELSYVRVDTSLHRTVSRENKDITASAVLFYDCHNSRPFDFKFTHGQKISFLGKDYTVGIIEPVYDNRQLHHIEVGLI